MTQTNLFPAILIAGAPNCGKSVLSFLLTQHLRAVGISHYLLRTAPDGEGDWFHLGDPSTVRMIRQHNKAGYTPELIAHMVSAINNRMLPLLVDIGGKPQGDQLNILRACTHSILLYRTDQQLAEWRALLAEMDLLPVAELCSDLEGEDAILSLVPVLEGVIAGLDRSEQKRRTGKAFVRLANNVAGICRYEEAFLQAEHIRRAPLPVVVERDLAVRIGAQSKGEDFYWQPGDLALLKNWVSSRSPMALYGRGPVWLSAALSVLALPAGAALFDARYGWVDLKDIAGSEAGAIQYNHHPFQYGDWLEIRLSYTVIEPEEIIFPVLESSQGVVISGRLPRWYFAALARHYAPQKEWVGVHAPQLNGVVVVSGSINLQVGSVLPVSREETGL